MYVNVLPSSMQSNDKCTEKTATHISADQRQVYRENCSYVSADQRQVYRENCSYVSADQRQVYRENCSYVSADQRQMCTERTARYFNAHRRQMYREKQQQQNATIKPGNPPNNSTPSPPPPPPPTHTPPTPTTPLPPLPHHPPPDSKRWEIIAANPPFVTRTKRQCTETLIIISLRHRPWSMHIPNNATLQLTATGAAVKRHSALLHLLLSAVTEQKVAPTTLASTLMTLLRAGFGLAVADSNRGPFAYQPDAC